MNTIRQGCQQLHRERVINKKLITLYIVQFLISTFNSGVKVGKLAPLNKTIIML